MIVDLPAPLSPASATTSPGKTSNDTRLSACTRAEAPWRRCGPTGSARRHSTCRPPPIRRRCVWSTSTEMMMTTPTAMNCQNGSTLMKTRPYWMTAMTSAPAIVPADRARAAEQARAADDDGGDRVEQQRLARLRGAGGEAAGVHRPRDARHDGGEQVEPQRQRLDVDAGAIRGGLARADRVGVLPEARLRQHVVQDEAGDAGDDHQHRARQGSGRCRSRCTSRCRWRPSCRRRRDRPRRARRRTCRACR